MRLAILPRMSEIGSDKRMAIPVELSRLSRAPILTLRRIIFALAVAVVADGLQFVTGPFGWAFGD